MQSYYALVKHTCAPQSKTDLQNRTKLPMFIKKILEITVPEALSLVVVCFLSFFLFVFKFGSFFFFSCIAKLDKSALIKNKFIQVQY